MEKFQGAKFSVHFLFFWISIYLFRRHTAHSCPPHFSSIQILQQEVNGKRKKTKLLSYEIRSISSVLLIKSYFNIKYSYSILYTSFSLLAEYWYWLFKQKNFNHFALQCFGGTIWFPAATMITVVGGKGKRERQGVHVPKLYIRLRSWLKEGKFFRM